MADDLITLNLGENSIRLVKAENEAGKINIELLVRQSDLPSFFESDTKKTFENVVTPIKKIVNFYRLPGKRVNVVIPDGFTYSQIVYMPRLKEKELLSAIKYQADQFIPMPIEETALDLEIIYEDDQANKLLVLIVAAPQDLIERVQKLSEQVGLFPETIENELSATGRFLANFYNPQAQTGGTVFINLGYSNTSFYFYDQKLKLLTESHNFPAGLSVFLREAQADINIDMLKAKNLLKKVGFAQDPSIDLSQILQPAIDALCTELQKYLNSLRAKNETYSVTRLFLFNLATEINQLDKKIEKYVSIPSAVFDPLPFTKRTPAAEPFIRDLSSFVPAIGGCLE